LSTIKNVIVAKENFEVQIAMSSQLLDIVPKNIKHSIAHAIEINEHAVHLLDDIITGRHVVIDANTDTRLQIVKKIADAVNRITNTVSGYMMAVDDHDKLDEGDIHVDIDA